MAEEKASKININGQEYEVKDAQARENIAALQTLLQQAQATIAELEALTPFDTTPTANSAKGVTSGGVKTALNEIPTIKAKLEATIEELKAITPFDTTPTANSAKGVTSGGVKTALNEISTIKAKLEAITPFDTTPTANSAKGVTSGGVKTALNAIPTIKKVTYQYQFNANRTCSCAAYGFSADKVVTDDPRQIAYWSVSYPPEVQNKVISYRITFWSEVNRIPMLTSDNLDANFTFYIDKGTSVGTGRLDVTFYYQ